MNLENISVNAQSSIRIRGSKTLYFDAFRFTSKSKDADFIFITHEHFDHYDIESINSIKKDSSIVVAPESMKDKLFKDGVAREDQDIFLVPGKSVTVDGIKIDAVPAYNVLKPFHPKHNQWLGYVVTMDDVTYYVAGDTDAIKENASIKCDVAIVPVGGGYTMDKKQAAEYVAKINPKATIPTHYGDVVGHPEDGLNYKQMIEQLNPEIQVELKL